MRTPGSMSAPGEVKFYNCAALGVAEVALAWSAILGSTVLPFRAVARDYLIGRDRIGSS